MIEPAAVAWPAVIAGALVACALSLILLALGGGLTLGHGMGATAAIWLVVTQWVSAGIGGYLAGRLRHRWPGTHSHEVFFRDTAQGLITWALATVVAAGLVAGSAAHIVFRTAAATTDANALTAGGAQYAVDVLFRPTPVVGPGGGIAATGADVRGEAQRLLMHGLTTGGLSPADHAYLSELVAQESGASAAESLRRVDDVTAALERIGEDARRTAAESSLYLALSLLMGAFIAGVAAALGGRERDEAGRQRDVDYQARTSAVTSR